jgi:hemolysin activation/secretion protein
MATRTTFFGLQLAATLMTAQFLTPIAAAQPAPAAPASSPHFEIDEFRVEGNTTLPNVDIERAVEKFLGPDRTSQDIEKARDALEKLYADKGFPTVSAEIPLQRMSEGVVILKVTERTVGRLRVTGSRYFAQGDIRAGAPSVAEGRVPNVTRLQNDIVSLNQRPDRTITPTLKAGLAPDTVDVDLQVADTLPLHASVELNNRYSESTKPLRALASLSYDNLWQRGDSATISYQVAPQRTTDVNVVSGSYLFHIPGTDLSLLGSYVHSDSDVTTVGDTNVIGKGDIAGFRLLVPLGTSEGFTHNLSIGPDYKKIGENVSLGGSVSSAPVTYYPLTATYQATWYDPDQTQTNLITSVTSTFRGFGSSPAQFDLRRFDATPNFTYLRADLTRAQTLPLGMQLYGHVTTQLAPEPLVSSEQFSIGGLDTVRGYLESEALGDWGVAAQLELRSPSLADYVDKQINELRLFTFFDAGVASIHNALPQQTVSSTLSSTGVGMRIRLLDYFNAEVAGAFTLSDGPNTRAGVDRVLFRVYGEF